VKHTFLEFECSNGQNSRVPRSHRRGSDSKIAYGLPLVSAEDGMPSAQFALTGPSGTSGPGAVDDASVLQASPRDVVITGEPDPERDEEEEDDDDDGAGRLSSRRSSADGFDTRHGSMNTFVGGKDYQPFGHTFSNASYGAADFSEPPPELLLRRRNNLQSLLTDAADDYLPAQAPAPTPITLPSMHYGGLPPPHVANTGFGMGLPHMTAPPGLVDDRSRFYGRQMQAPPHGPLPHLAQQMPLVPQYHPQHVVAGRPPYCGTRGGSSWPPGYFGPVGWPHPASGAMQMQRVEAGCRSAGAGFGAGRGNNYNEHAHYRQPPSPQVGASAATRTSQAASGDSASQTQQDGQAQPRTTVMLRNLPEGFARNMLIKMLDDAGFAGLYDFVYMPMNFRTKSSFGYAFVNMVSPSVAQYCHDHFQGFRNWGVPTDKVCEVSWSDMHQGLTAHIHRYRNSPVMHESVPDEYKPVMYSSGVRVQFPPPTKKLRVPRIRRSPESFADDFDEDAMANEPWTVEES